MFQKQPIFDENCSDRKMLPVESPDGTIRETGMIVSEPVKDNSREVAS
jgi:hypothetical protein